MALNHAARGAWTSQGLASISGAEGAISAAPPVTGTPGPDSLAGTAGDDRIEGGGGDVLVGGEGADAPGGGGVADVRDTGEDTVLVLGDGGRLVLRGFTGEDVQTGLRFDAVDDINDLSQRMHGYDAIVLG